MSAELKVLDINNLTDVVHMMRVIADRIENGEYGDMEEIKGVVVVIRTGDNITTSSFGLQSDYYYTLATLALAQHDMME